MAVPSSYVVLGRWRICFFGRPTTPTSRDRRPRHRGQQIRARDAIGGSVVSIVTRRCFGTCVLFDLRAAHIFFAARGTGSGAGRCPTHWRSERAGKAVMHRRVPRAAWLCAILTTAYGFSNAWYIKQSGQIKNTGLSPFNRLAREKSFRPMAGAIGALQARVGAGCGLPSAVTSTRVADAASVVMYLFGGGAFRGAPFGSDRVLARLEVTANCRLARCFGRCFRRHSEPRSNQHLQASPCRLRSQHLVDLRVAAGTSAWSIACLLVRGRSAAAGRLRSLFSRRGRSCCALTRPSCGFGFSSAANFRQCRHG